MSSSLESRYRVGLPLSTWIVLSVAALMTVAYGVIQFEPSPAVAQILDNSHWTASYVAAAWLSWLGVRHAVKEEQRARQWFAWGLTLSAAGQLVWNVQVVVGWQSLAGPSDLLYACLGPCCAAGLWTSLNAHSSKAQLRAGALDATALALTTLALLLALYVPRLGTSDTLYLLLPVIYVATLVGAATTGLIVALTLRLRPAVSWLLLVTALVAAGGVAMYWNYLQLSGQNADGTAFNLTFSAVNLALGQGARLWRVGGLSDPRLDRRYEMVVRVLPLVLVMLAAGSVVVAGLFVGVPAWVEALIKIIGFVVVVVAVWRQNVLLKERDHLLAAEHRVHESESRYRTLFESSLDGIFIQSGERILDCNERALQMLECSQEQVIGRSLLDLAPDRVVEGRSPTTTLRERLEEALAGVRQVFEGQVTRPAGTVFDAEISLHRLAVRGRAILQIMVRDISARKEAEEALKNSEARFSTSFESAGIGMALVATDGKFLKVNHALCQMVGYTTEEMMERTFQDLTHPEDLEADLALLEKALRGELDSYQMEKRYFHRSGAVVSALLSVSLVRDSRRQPLHFTSQIQDVTQRKKLEDQFRQSQKMEAVGQLAGGVAHDFNNILTVIQGYASMIEHGGIARESAVREITEAVDRAASLTRQLLTFSRKQVMQPRDLDLNRVVDSMTSMLVRTLGEHVTLAVERGADLPVVHADQSMMEQILLNLAVNARDAMPKGGRLTIATGRAVIGEEDARQHPEVRTGLAASLCVIDTGCGIPLETQARIFEPFFTTKEVNQGSGLGLATVHGIVRQHRGVVRLQSTVGEGTRFDILLPATTNPTAAMPKPDGQPKEKSVQGGSEKILLVDDEPALRLVSKLTLKHYGYQVLEAASGRQAVQLMDEHAHEIDLLLTDMVMPEGMSGKELADHLRATRPELRVLFTSGYSVELLNRNLSLPGDVWFLPKPFTTQRLAQIVRDCLNSPPSQS